MTLTGGLKQLELSARAQGITTRWVGPYFGLLYRDGLDEAFFASDPGPGALEAFLDMDRHRWRVLSAFRHWLHARDIRIFDPRATTWCIGTAGFSTRAVVDLRLTDEIARSSEVGALRGLLGVLDPDQRTGNEAGALLERDGPPTDERPWVELDNDAVGLDDDASGELGGLDEMLGVDVPEFAFEGLRKPRDRAALDARARQIIDAHLATPQSRLREDPLWYTPGGDVWVDDAWWVRWASGLPEDAWGIAMPILLDHDRAAWYRAAAGKIDEWIEEGGYDGIGDDVMKRLYPDHVASREFVEGSDSGFLQLRKGRLSAIRMITPRPDEFLDAERMIEAPTLWKYGRDMASWLFSAQQLAVIRQWCLDKVGGGIGDAFASGERALRCAVAMGWPEVADALMENGRYLAWRFLPRERFTGRPTDPFPLRAPHEPLAVSLLRPGHGCERFVARVLESAQYDDEMLAAAIAWLRSRRGGAAV